MTDLWRFDDWYLIDIGEEGKEGFQPKSKRINPGDKEYGECQRFEREHPDKVVVTVTKTPTKEELRAKVVASRKTNYTVLTDGDFLASVYDAHKDAPEPIIFAGVDITAWVRSVREVKLKYPFT